nr:MAG TPA: hypothetical protein [Caudoviricetes sp.]DAX16973.1 MAG TPA: hypothetical protein [Caudoviricetes sp.]
MFSFCEFYHQIIWKFSNCILSLQCVKFINSAQRYEKGA